ncbi:MAG: hypothetical protein KAW17_05460 [Candidatus Eisenbacteria sp.]|nr:hypothetical protein [Candidatus Eisenbacteria bacterium]
MSRRSAVLGIVVAIVIGTMSAGPCEAKDPVGASITFCSNVGKSSGKMYGVADSFVLKSGKKLRGVVDVENAEPGEELVFHLLWVKPTGKKAFVKRVAMTPEESTTRFQTSLSLNPEKREAGTYLLKVYLFRKLLVAREVDLQSS